MRCGFWGWALALFLPKRSTGAQGEALAAQHLKQHHYRILGRNLRTRLGEVDLVALAPDRQTLVCIEVKTQAHAAHNPAHRPQQRVTLAKQKKITAVMVQLAQQHRLTRHPMRFDIISVTLDAPSDQRVQHLPGAFEARM